MGFNDFSHPDYVCLLKKSLYGLKQTSPSCLVETICKLYGINQFQTL